MKLEVVHLIFTIVITIVAVYDLIVGFMKRDTILLVCGVWSAILSVICIEILGEMKRWW